MIIGGGRLTINVTAPPAISHVSQNALKAKRIKGSRHGLCCALRQRIVFVGQPALLAEQVVRWLASPNGKVDQRGASRDLFPYLFGGQFVRIKVDYLSRLTVHHDLFSDWPLTITS